MTTIIDADGHIVEPRFFWNEYVEPAFRDRVPQIVKDDEGTDRVKYNGEFFAKSVIAPAAMCIPGGLSEPQRARTLSWDDLRPGSFDPHERVKDMDIEGIDVSILYPSICMFFTGMKDSQLAAAAC
ncbi:MAG: hypothetical protein AB7P69_24615, partial [Candidatus Binatia bacterium]